MNEWIITINVLLTYTNTLFHALLIYQPSPITSPIFVKKWPAGIRQHLIWSPETIIEGDQIIGNFEHLNLNIIQPFVYRVVRVDSSPSVRSVPTVPGPPYGNEPRNETRVKCLRNHFFPCPQKRVPHNTRQIIIIELHSSKNSGGCNVRMKSNE